MVITCCLVELCCFGFGLVGCFWWLVMIVLMLDWLGLCDMGVVVGIVFVSCWMFLILLFGVSGLFSLWLVWG